MKITYPHLGNSYIILETLLQALGHEPITPPLGNKRTLELGVRLSPEQICLPFKIILGNLLQGLELGAEGVWMLGGWGPCLLGYYGEAQRILLEQELGEVEFILLEMPRSGLGHSFNLINSVVKKTEKKNILQGSKLAWVKLVAVEALERQAIKTRAQEQTRGVTSKILASYLQQLRECECISQISSILETSKLDFLSSQKTCDQAPIKIALVGEIYTLMEPLANLNLEERLGELGVEVVRTVSLSTWVDEHIFQKLLGRSHLVPLKKAAQGYLHSFVGGHGLESVAHSVKYARMQVHGIIQILPLGCTPEIIAQGILPQVSRDFNLPILTLVVDEHAGESGYQTRIEAFVDLLERKVYNHV